MQLPPLDPDKRYYSIGEVAQLLEVNASLIRFWEREFPALEPTKNARGKRMYTPENLQGLAAVYHLVKERGFTLEGARQHLKNKGGETLNHVELRARLNHIRQQLSQLKQQLLNP
jgi:DNA-binding transcriptional MerR regulator